MKRVTEPKPPREALSAIEAFFALPGIELITVPDDVVERLLGLIRRRPVTRGKVYDLQLVATMLGHGLTRIYTFNAQDFRVFDELEVLVPGEPTETPTTPPRQRVPSRLEAPLARIHGDTGRSLHT